MTEGDFQAFCSPFQNKVTWLVSWISILLSKKIINHTLKKINHNLKKEKKKTGNSVYNVVMLTWSELILVKTGFASGSGKTYCSKNFWIKKKKNPKMFIGWAQGSSDTMILPSVVYT